MDDDEARDVVRRWLTAAGCLCDEHTVDHVLAIAEVPC